MQKAFDELPSDNRNKYEWQSRYEKDPKSGKDPRKIMKGEAIYLFSLILLAFVLIILNYKNVFSFLLQIPENESKSAQRVIYCMCAGLLGGVTFSIKIFYRAVARGKWNLDRQYWRIFSPLISLSVTSVVTAFMIEDILTSYSYWPFAIGYFAGYFSENAVGKMYDIAVILFSTPSEKDKDSEEMNTENGNCKNNYTDSSN